MWSDISFLMYSSTAYAVLKEIGKTPKTTKTINKKLDINEQSLSRTLRKLRERKLIVCLTPERPAYRFFRITPKAQKVLIKMKKMKLI